ncbi:MAG: polyphosphate kinase 1 [Planctomycetes bacterium]|nr:polyphosphate kinase 1 [Planctomycetota bacterium]
MSSVPSPDLGDPLLYLNRELSLLEFNARVLEQAKDAATPLLERLRFLTICSTNLDEFFEIRVSGLKQQLSFGVARAEPDGMSTAETLQRISESAHALVAEQYRVFNDVLLPALDREGIRLLKRSMWSARQQRWIKRYFMSEVLPVLTPVGLDPAHPFPRILNKSLNFVVSVDGDDAFGRSAGIAIVQVPRSLPRLITMPGKVAGGPHEFALLSSILHAHIGEVFPGMSVRGCYQFRLTRNSDLWVDEEEADDLMRALKGELADRNFGDAVRLEVADTCTDEMASFLLKTFELGPEDLYRVHGPVNMHRVVAMHELVERPDLKYAPFLQRVPRRVEQGGQDMFEVLRRGDLLLHHPFDSFGPVVEFVRQAAADPSVLAIKQTLYRSGADSPLVDALIDAARAGKEVTAVVELRARFDEAANINLATRLQKAGANVVYGIVGYKAHAKMLLVVRREGRKLRRYVHLGTGNYHVRTTRGYTDVGFMTCDREIGEDVHRLFMQLTGLGRVTRLKKIVQSPFALQRALLEHIEFEARQARSGKPARIVAKMNALTDQQMIQALYQASRAGVSIDLLVRGTCCLRPGIPGVSENIRVRSVIGRFLEHSRIFYFYAAGQELCFCASADWMQRNLFRRVETCFPIEERRLVQRLVSEGLEPYLADNAQAWLLQPDGKYLRAKPGKQPRRAAQELLLERLCERPELEAGSEETPTTTERMRIAVAEAIEEKKRRAKRKRDAGELGSTQRRARRKGSSVVLEPIVPPEEGPGESSPEARSGPA